jgi:hypothetical protein
VFDGARKAVSGATEDIGAAEGNKGSAFLLTSLTFIAGIFAALGVSNGTVSNMVRNHGVWAGFAIGIGVVAVLAGVWAGTKKANRESQSKWIFWGLVLLLAAAVCAVIAAVEVTGDETAPRVSATVEPSTRGNVVNLGVQTAGLKHDERVDLAVWPLLSEVGGSSLPKAAGTVNSRYDYYAGGVPLYRSVLGPDGNGEISIEHRASLPLDHPSRVLVQAEVGEAHPLDCFDPGSRAGCVFLDLGQSGRPRLAVSTPRPGSHRSVRIHLSASDVAGETMFLSVANGPGRHHQVMEAQFAPDPAGNLVEKPVVRLPSGTHSVCVVANTIATQSCPPLTQPPQSVLNDCIASIVHKPVLGSTTQTTKDEARKRCLASYPRQEQRSTSWVRLQLP